MNIKLQNVLFVLGVTFVIQLLYMLLMFIIFLLNNNLAVNNEELFLFVLDNVLFVSIALGAINLFSNRLSLYIYEKSIKKIPNLRWYCMFFSWTVIIQKFIPEFEIFYAVLISCIVGALCYPDRTWKQRVRYSLIFVAILLMYFLGGFTDFEN